MRELAEIIQMIEAERRKLDRELKDGDIKAHYQRSLILDGLIEEYLDVKEHTVSLH